MSSADVIRGFSTRGGPSFSTRTELSLLSSDITDHRPLTAPHRRAPGVSGAQICSVCVCGGGGTSPPAWRCRFTVALDLDCSSEKRMADVSCRTCSYLSTADGGREKRRLLRGVSYPAAATTGRQLLIMNFVGIYIYFSNASNNYIKLNNISAETGNFTYYLTICCIHLSHIGKFVTTALTLSRNGATLTIIYQHFASRVVRHATSMSVLF